MSLEGKTEDEIRGMAELTDSLLNNPKYRLPYLRMQKQANPNVNIPEIDVLDTVGRAVQPHLKKIEEMEAEREHDKQVRAADSLYNNLREDRVVAKRKDFEELVEYASKEGFQTSEDGLRKASSHRRSEKEAAEPTPMPGSRGHGIWGDKTVMKDWMKDPAGRATEEANKAMDEIIRNRGKQAA